MRRGFGRAHPGDLRVGVGHAGNHHRIERGRGQLGIAQQFAGNPNLPPEARQIALERLGLDKPLMEQFWSYLFNFFQGDLGFSFDQYPRPVVDLIGERLPRTLVLFTTALLVTYWAGFISGKYLAWRRDTRGEMAITIAGVALYTVFYPWFAILLIWLFAIQLEWLPINQFLTDRKSTRLNSSHSQQSRMPSSA